MEGKGKLQVGAILVNFSGEDALHGKSSLRLLGCFKAELGIV
jgi:hypothetical protein